MLLLVGAQVSAEIEHQTTVDSTVGPSRVLGERGAKMADSVGQSLSVDEHGPPDPADLPVVPAAGVVPLKIGGLVALTLVSSLLGNPDSEADAQPDEAD